MAGTKYANVLDCATGQEAAQLSWLDGSPPLAQDPWPELLGLL